jgi:hypothetical protein
LAVAEPDAVAPDWVPCGVVVDCVDEPVDAGLVALALLLDDAVPRLGNGISA